MTVVLNAARGIFTYTCDYCDRVITVHADDPPAGWEERTPDLGPNYHVCAGCATFDSLVERFDP